MSQEILSIPLKLKNIIEGYFLKENITGCSLSTVYKLTHQKLPSLYLKVLEKNSSENLHDEYLRLNWLKHKMPVPEVEYFLSDNTHEYLLISEITGEDASIYINNAEPEYLIKILAEGLKFIHSIDISECKFDQSLNIKLKKAYFNMINNLVDEDDFDLEYKGKSSEELYNHLNTLIPDHEELVLTHGDYSLPNIIINDNKIKGFIDIGRLGIADKYQDLALAIRSIEFNYGRNYTSLFFKYYGLNKINYNKIKFYQLLDEFF